MIAVAQTLTSLLEQLSKLSSYVIVASVAVHLFVFFILWVWAGRDLRQIASTLFDLTRGLKNQSLLDSTAHLSDQIEAFLADVQDVLDDPARGDDREQLIRRMRIIDERRRYLNSMLFDTIYNVARSMIEAYPLMGILGTVLAIGAALQAQGATVDNIVTRFGESIWATFAGLFSAIILMFINSFLETGFVRLSENRRQVRETVARVKRELSMSVAQHGGPT